MLYRGGLPSRKGEIDTVKALAYDPMLIPAAVLSAAALGMVLRKMGRERRWHAGQRASFDHMSCETFREYVEQLFRAGGYTGGRTSGEARIMKRYGTSLALISVREGVRVGPEDVQRVAGIRDTEDCEEGTLVSVPGFTPQARREAMELGIELIDSRDLCRLAQRLEHASLPPMLLLMEAGEGHLGAEAA